MRFSQKLYAFLQGRNGVDALGRASLWLLLLLVLLNLFLRSWVLSILYDVILVLALYRMLSRNLWQRQRENQFYLRHFAFLENWAGRVRRWGETRRTRATDVDHKYLHCKACHATIRVPRVKGKHGVKCPKCGHTFQVRI